MNEAEGLKVSYAVNELTWILDRDLDETDNRVRLAPTDRSRIDRARTGCIALLRQAQAKAEQKAEAFLALLETAESTDAQGELFDGSGRPLTAADANGAIPETQRHMGDDGERFANLEFEEPLLEGLEGSPGSSGSSQPIDTPEDSGSLLTPLEERREASLEVTKELILEKLDQGLGKGETISQVSSLRGEPKTRIEELFAEMLEAGAILKQGRTYLRSGQTPSEANEQLYREDLTVDQVGAAILAKLREQRCARVVTIEAVAEALPVHSFKAREAWARLEASGQVVQDQDGLWVAAEAVVGVSGE